MHKRSQGSTIGEQLGRRAEGTIRQNTKDGEKMRKREDRKRRRQEKIKAKARRRPKASPILKKHQERI